jgi:hypothetical protein
MPKRTGVKPKRPKDVSQWAHQIVKESTQEKPETTIEPANLTKSEVSRFMAEMGRKGGLKGGKRRMALLSDEERSDLASKAAHALWAKKRANS